MNADSYRGASAPVVVVALGLSLIAGQAASQIETREWLAPQGGLWSNPSNWSDSNVPDTFDESARLSPSPELGSGVLGTALIDSFIEVSRVYANGFIDIHVAPGSELFVRYSIVGEDNGQARVVLGGDSPSGQESKLVFDNVRSGIFNTTVLMSNDSGGSHMELNGGVINDTSVVRGIGVIESGSTGANNGLIESSEVAADNNVLLIRDSEMFHRGTIRAAAGSEIHIESSWLDCSDGGQFIAEDDIVIQDTEIIGGTFIREGRGEVKVLNETSFEHVTLEPIVVDVEGDLTLRGGELVNNGFINLAEGGTITFDEGTELSGEGRISFWRPNSQVRIIGLEEAVLTNGADHLLEGRGEIRAGLTNWGTLAIRGQDQPRNTLRIRGPFEQQNGATLDIIAREDNGRFGVDQLLIDRNSAVLGGTLYFRLTATAGDEVGQPFPIIRILQNDPAQQIVGTFDDVIVQRTSSSTDISGRVEVTYKPTSVEVAWYCRADVNRNGTVEPTDFTAWVTAYNNQDELADINENGNIDMADFNSWMFYYNRPCGH